jgi:hypothetical protein
MGKPAMAGSGAQPYSALTLQELQAHRQRAVEGKAQAEHGAGFQGRINLIDQLIKAKQAPPPVAKPAPVAAPVAAAVVPPPAAMPAPVTAAPIAPVFTPPEVKVADAKATEITSQQTQ